MSSLGTRRPPAAAEALICRTALTSDTITPRARNAAKMRAPKDLNLPTRAAAHLNLELVVKAIKQQQNSQYCLERFACLRS